MKNGALLSFLFSAFACGAEPSTSETLTVEWFDGLPGQCGLYGMETLDIQTKSVNVVEHGTTSAFAWVGETDDRVMVYDLEYDGGARGIMADRVAGCTQSFYVR